MMGTRETLLLFVLIGLTSSKPYTVSRGNDARMCRTDECRNAAHATVSAMDTSLDPCNNFYQYACAGWIGNHPIPEDSPTYSQFREASERNLQRLRDILDTDYSEDRDAIRKAKMFYESCMTEDSIESLGAETALDFIDELGGMPLFDGRLQYPNFNLERYLAMTKRTIEKINSPIIKISVRVDDMNASRYVISLDQPHLIMPNPVNYLSPEFNSTRVTYIQFLQSYLGELWMSMDQHRGTATFDDVALSQAVNEILELESDLAKILVPHQQRNDILKMYNKMTIGELSIRLSSEFNWLEFINGVMSQVGIEVDSTTEIVIYSKSYLSKMMSVLRKYNERKLKNYVVARNLVTHIDLLSKKYRDTQTTYRKALTGAAKESPRWQLCSWKANELIPMAVGALYAKQVFPEENRATALETIDNVIMSFKDNLGNTEWMDQATKQAALLKADNVNKLVGYPDYILDEKDPALDEEYENVEVSVEEYFKSEIEIRGIQFRKSLERLNDPVDKSSWNIPPAKVNAFYQPNFNNMVFPAGILQQPFFNSARPFAMNYGSIGAAAGHEITHGFDTSGSRYNAFGNLENWWTNSSRKSFEAAAQRLKTQYSNFYYEPAGMYVNGNLTLSEDIADNGGIRNAYDGYKLWRGLNPGMEFQIPGLEHYTFDQLFFISFAQVWCSAERNEHARQMTMNSPHSPFKFRVEGTFQNFEKFGEAFGCVRGEDKLYPDPSETCRVW